ncbi:hypothetical protein AK812_SmicGene45780 [Symbiodinium microadriaticum]|uniref:Uncharacterized protein n=1 Tax=Symbiodinium microadriaticum TaxID=2951 RepID=A0A1Q9BVA5_SYMMI|nr:hypothetical protein AK812_SmicGene45780 [Symbiodinium microadriaticum]
MDSDGDSIAWSSLAGWARGLPEARGELCDPKRWGGKSALLSLLVRQIVEEAREHEIQARKERRGGQKILEASIFARDLLFDLALFTVTLGQS